jgi:hypothetical protein
VFARQALQGSAWTAMPERGGGNGRASGLNSDQTLNMLRRFFREPNPVLILPRFKFAGSDSYLSPPVWPQPA